MDVNKLINAAIAARELSYSPYSGFMVGAALLTRSGKVYTGCNIENAAYSPTNCAERTAFFKAVSEGERGFKAIAVTGWGKNSQPVTAYPCGLCLQVMAEFCGPEFIILAAKGPDDYEAFTLAELLPKSFSLD
jgi:cytidine deaminase